MKVNTQLRKEILQVVDNQLKSNDPEETNITYRRLLGLGYSQIQAKTLIGQCVSVELFLVIKEQKPFDEARYIKNLKQLPKEPFD